MAGEIALATIGTTIQWAAEVTAGTRPTTGYVAVKGITSIGELDSDPETADVTPLEELFYKQYIELLKDTGGVMSLGYNLTDDFMTAWDAVMTASEGKTIWWAIVIKGLAKAFYFTGTPSPLGLPGLEVNAPVQGTAKIVTNVIEGFDVAPTVTP